MGRMSKNATVYIAMGGNVGNVKRTLLAAVRMMAEHEGIVLRRMSDFILTEPVYLPGAVDAAKQEKYLNAAVKIETTLSPRELLAALQRIESHLGRDRAKEGRWGPRTCDLDILLFGDLVMDSPDLTIPHPRLHERAFMLAPLAQIAPEAVHPVLKKTVVELLAGLPKELP